MPVISRHRGVLLLVVLAVLLPQSALAQAVEWRQLHPVARYGHAMAFDSARGRAVMFGGAVFLNSSAGTYNGETWEWNGATPNAASRTHHDVPGPAPRYAHAMTYDAARGVTVLFGGYTGTGSLNNETWEWDGTAWTQRLVGAPAARWQYAMVYDETRTTVVLFGGMTTTTNSIPNGEPWEWNGTSWAPSRLPARRPAARTRWRMTRTAGLPWSSEAERTSIRRSAATRPGGVARSAIPIATPADR